MKFDDKKFANDVHRSALCRYVTAGAAWLNGAFTKVAKVGNVAGTKTRQKFHTAMSNLTAKVRFLQATFVFSNIMKLASIC